MRDQPDKFPGMVGGVAVLSVTLAAGLSVVGPAQAAQPTAPGWRDGVCVVDVNGRLRASACDPSSETVMYVLGTKCVPTWWRYRRISRYLDRQFGSRWDYYYPSPLGANLRCVTVTSYLGAG